MATSKSSNCIRLQGVRQNNLKGFDLDLPMNRLIVITGLSGSGKSSLAFDTLYAEGQRRYIETFSPYTRQFFDRMDKPQVDAVEGIPPAIAIEQRNAVKTTRSTVGTMTEINEHMKQLWPLVATLFCRQCSRPVSRETPQVVYEQVQSWFSSERQQSGQLLVSFDLPLVEKLSLKESLDLIAKQGYRRLLVRSGGSPSKPDPLSPRGTHSVQGSDKPVDALRESTVDEYRTALDHEKDGGGTFKIIRVEEALEYFGKDAPGSLIVIQDRFVAGSIEKPRFVEACEQAYHFGKGRLTVWLASGSTREAESRILREQHFSKHFHCAQCDLEYREPTPALFSFNHPLGACPSCRGFGRIITIDYNLAIPDRSLSLAEGAVKPWRTGTGADSQEDLEKFCKKRKVPMDVPFKDLPESTQQWVINGDPDYGKDRKHQWPHAWYGVKGYFRWLESKAYKMHVRVLLSRYRAYVLCPDCRGNRLQPESLLYRLPVEDATLSLSEFYRLPIRDSLQIVDFLIERFKPRPNEPMGLVLGEVRSRLHYLSEIGLGYLTLDRPTRSLSGGETERVNLTACLGSRLVNTLYVLDEPSVGLHPRDTDRLVAILLNLRSAGNTVVVVEHERGVMEAADQIVDLGPGHGESGGELVFQGTCSRILKSKRSLTGRYLAGRLTIPIPDRRPVESDVSPPGSGRNGLVPAGWLRVRNATRHNLNHLNVDIPLGRMVCLTGVSGSGKTTLARDILLPLLADRLGQGEEVEVDRDRDSEDDDETSESSETSITTTVEGAEAIQRVVLVDQSPIGRTPRSNPAVYIGAFDDIRELFARTEAARMQGLSASSFSFNSQQGQCDRCRGAGFEKIEMQFLSDVFIRCPVCEGRRYRQHILDIHLELKSPRHPHKTEWSIADLLDATVDEAIELLEPLDDSRQAMKSRDRLKILQEVGLGYLKLGQPINTLSGGECQRLKLVSHLSSVVGATKAKGSNNKRGRSGKTPDACKPILFLFDEPTTGLHFEDVRVLLLALQRLVDSGHSVLVIEHHLDVIKSADWVIDLGPGAGDEGGRLVAAGPPERLTDCLESFTGSALKEYLREGTKRK